MNQHKLFAAICSVVLSAGAASPKLTFTSSDAKLQSAFEWASQQALAYAAHGSGDPVGDWYEAALPGRQAFCMRDTSHQAAAAHFLGLDSHNRNMLRKFAENISESKDWCSYWEINRDNRPAPVDYQSDTRFWYNLPANFDVLDACYRVFRWTGDSTYLNDAAFQTFYRRSVVDYVARWDLAPERIMLRPRIMNVREQGQTNRGIPSYDESDPQFTVAVDQLAAEYAGFRAYAQMAGLLGRSAEAREFLAKAESVKQLVNTTWWDASSHKFYSRLNLNHRLESHELTPWLLYYGVAEQGERASAVVHSMVETVARQQPIGIELESYFPEILYRYGQPDAAYRTILDLTRQDKPRRDYPEVSFAVVNAIVTGVMGIEGESTIVTTPRLSAQTAWAEIASVPVRGNTVTVRHTGVKQTALANVTGPSLRWQACFPGSFKRLALNGRTVAALHQSSHGRALSCASTQVGSQQTARIGVASP